MASSACLDTTPMQRVSQKQAEGERNRKGETTGRQDGPSASSGEAKPGKASKVARKGSEVDELFSQLKKAKANGRAEPQKVQYACMHTAMAHLQL